MSEGEARAADAPEDGEAIEEKSTEDILRDADRTIADIIQWTSASVAATSEVRAEISRTEANIDQHLQNIKELTQRRRG